MAVALPAASAAAGDIAGQASVIDGDTLDIHGTRVRLWGIDAPESDQLCRGDDSLPYRCGATAANKLDAFIDRRPVHCRQRDIDRYGRIVATCVIGDTDIGEWLVGRGLALDWPRYSGGHYAAAQRGAESGALGIWAGSFVEPWRYRTCRAANGRPAACSDDPARP
ncbi:thermonuclease family protein [Bradyrhizobium sp. NP1]|uniref:thermonuclease family protein n=1 Tax=Bradyrhizobium sp. NP1 TaxID=3049772 RepID=UPI0025A5E6FD|nr:thermonuclease family protein [Bradyrhizobium sp. NP1]WJR74938.1 thermonuclease family protein [Bradyrhizobium sp. NP1]